MQQSRPVAAEAGTPGDIGFFIPNLCAPPAVFFAVLLGEIAVLLHVLALGPLATFDWRALAMASIFVQWNTLTCIALLCFLRRFLQRLSPALATAACLFLVVVVSVAWTLLIYELNPLLRSGAGGLVDWCTRNALLAVILAAVVLRYAYLQQKVAIQQRSELQLRLDALRSRIRPHFLFNTLNSIASLISVQPDRAEQAIEDVAELFRAALADRALSNLRDECHLCSLYLDIEKLRLGERLDVSWAVAPGLDDVPIPALLIQPLVENAVYHGVSRLGDGGLVAIACYQESGFLVIDVCNPVPDSSAGRDTGGHHMALENIRQRLDALYSGRASMRADVADQIYCASIRLPLADETTPR